MEASVRTLPAILSVISQKISTHPTQIRQKYTTQRSFYIKRFCKNKLQYLPRFTAAKRTSSQDLQRVKYFYT